MVAKNPPASAEDIRDTGSIPESGRSAGGGHGNPLQYSCLENPMDREAWWATVRRAAESQTRQKRLRMHTRMLQFKKRKEGGFPGGPVAKTPCSECRRPRFDPWLDNSIPHAHNEDQRSCVLQLRPGVTNYFIYIYTHTFTHM